MSDLAALAFVQAPAAPTTFNVLLYGPPGSGKSTAAATAPGSVLWINCQGGNALANARKIAGARGSRIDEVRLNRGTPNVKNQIRAVIEHLRGQVDPVPATVVVDTFGDLRELLIRQIVQPGASNSIQQFGEVAKTLSDFVVALRDIDVNVVLICHEDIQDNDGERVVRPLIGGALTERVPAEVDVMAYCAVHQAEDKQVQYLGQLVEGRGRRAKDRSGALGKVRPLDLTDWLAAYVAGLSPEDPFAPEAAGDATPADPDADVVLGADSHAPEQDGDDIPFDPTDAPAEEPTQQELAA